MIQLPDFSQAFDHENNFYLSSGIDRLIKPIIHYELYKRTTNVPGAFVELGIFKGTSFTRFLAYRHMLEAHEGRKFVGFDVFGKFPLAKLKKDKEMLNKYLSVAGNESISEDQLKEVIKHKGVTKKVELVAGDIAKTVPKFIEQNPGIRFSLIHLDVDLYEPSKIALQYLFPKLSKGGILILDDYGIWEGETKAVDEYFSNKEIKIERFPFGEAPSFIIKP